MRLAIGRHLRARWCFAASTLVGALSRVMSTGYPLGSKVCARLLCSVPGVPSVPIGVRGPLLLAGQMTTSNADAPDTR